MRFIIVCFLLIISNAIHAQIDYEIYADSSDLEIRVFDEEKLDVYRQDRDFNYGRDPKYETNFLRRIWLYLINKFREIFGAEGSSFISKLFWYGLGLAGLIYLIQFLIKKEGSRMFARPDSRVVNLGLESLTGPIDANEFDQLISNAIANEEYRLAIRLNFIKTLKFLNSNDFIVWKDYKTNTDYFRELKEKSFQQKFKDLSFSYEYIWYGEFEPNKDEFEEIQLKFDEFFSQSKSVKI